MTDPTTHSIQKSALSAVGYPLVVLGALACPERLTAATTPTTPGPEPSATAQDHADANLSELTISLRSATEKLRIARGDEVTADDSAFEQYRNETDTTDIAAVLERIGATSERSPEEIAAAYSLFKGQTPLEPALLLTVQYANSEHPEGDLYRTYQQLYKETGDIFVSASLSGAFLSEACSTQQIKDAITAIDQLSSLFRERDKAPLVALIVAHPSEQVEILNFFKVAVYEVEHSGSPVFMSTAAILTAIGYETGQEASALVAQLNEISDRLIPTGADWVEFATKIGVEPPYAVLDYSTGLGGLGELVLFGLLGGSTFATWLGSGSSRKN